MIFEITWFTYLQHDSKSCIYNKIKLFPDPYISELYHFTCIKELVQFLGIDETDGGTPPPPYRDVIPKKTKTKDISPPFDDSIYATPKQPGVTCKQVLLCKK